MWSVEVDEIDENLHRLNMTPAQETIAIRRLEALSIKMEKKAADEAAKLQVISVTNVTETKGKVGRPAVSKAGSTHDIAKKHGVSAMQVSRAKKRDKVLTPALVDRIAHLPAFDKPAAVNALMAMDRPEREAVVSRIECGEKITVTIRQPRAGEVARPAPAISEPTLRDEILALFNRKTRVLEMNAADAGRLLGKGGARKGAGRPAKGIEKQSMGKLPIDYAEPTPAQVLADEAGVDRRTVERGIAKTKMAEATFDEPTLSQFRASKLHTA